MKNYSTADRASIFSGRPENYRVNLLRRRCGNNWYRVESKWFAQLECASNYAADNGCVVECDMGNEWYADAAFANHNASAVALLTRRA
jgi:hypothetical protein